MDGSLSLEGRQKSCLCFGVSTILAQGPEQREGSDE